MKKNVEINLTGILYLLKLISKKKLVKIFSKMLDTAIQVSSKGVIINDAETLFELIENKYQISITIVYIMYSVTFNIELNNNIGQNVVEIKELKKILEDLPGVLSLSFNSDDNDDEEANFSIDISKEGIKLAFNETKIEVI